MQRVVIAVISSFSQMAKSSGENFQTRIYAPHPDSFRSCNETNNLEEEKLYQCLKIIRL